MKLLLLVVALTSVLVVANADTDTPIFKASKALSKVESIHRMQTLTVECKGCDDSTLKTRMKKHAIASLSKISQTRDNTYYPNPTVPDLQIKDQLVSVEDMHSAESEYQTTPEPAHEAFPVFVPEDITQPNSEVHARGTDMQINDAGVSVEPVPELSTTEHLPEMDYTPPMAEHDHEHQDHEHQDHEHQDHEHQDHEHQDHEHQDHEHQDHEHQDHEHQDHEHQDHEHQDHEHELHP